MKTHIKILIILLFLAIAIWFYTIIGLIKEIKNDKNMRKQTKTDSLTYQIKVRDSIIYDLYQENKLLKLQQNNFQ
jgi:hypothetical protein